MSSSGGEIPSGQVGKDKNHANGSVNKQHTRDTDAELDRYLDEIDAREEHQAAIERDGAHLRLVQSVDEPVNSTWKKKLLRKGKAGEAKKVVANVLAALRHAPQLQGMLRYNAFSHRVEVIKRPPWVSASAPWEMVYWSDSDDILLTEWLQKQGIEVPTGITKEAIIAASNEHQYHPVKEYLDKLKWDGVKRIDDWLITYLGAEASDYHRAIGKRWLISGIVRILDPGPDCKADCVLVLEGEQGLQKSTALKTLAGHWFLDDLRKFGSKDATMQIAGRWIVELAELTAMNDATIEACKAFFSQTMDTFRPPYGRRIIDAPRQCIFAASTNKNIFLRDETGDRRYWPVACTRIDIEALRRDRHQLWAEAQELYRAGHKWWLETPELAKLAEIEQRMRFDVDPWEPRIEKFLENQMRTTPEDILLDVFDYELVEITKHLRNRVSAILRHLEWKRVRVKERNMQRDSYQWVPSK